MCMLTACSGSPPQCSTFSSNIIVQAKLWWYVQISFQLLHTESMIFYTCPLTHTQPPPEFQPPIFGYLSDGPVHYNGWYYGQLRERQGVFASEYVQFRYSCKLMSNSKNLPTSLCTSDTVHLLSVNHAVLCSGNVCSIAQRNSNF